MPTYSNLYTGQTVKSDKRRRRLEKSPRWAEVEETSGGGYGSLKKDELVALADERQIDSSGNKGEIIERLEAADAEQG